MNYKAVGGAALCALTLPMPIGIALGIGGVIFGAYTYFSEEDEQAASTMAQKEASAQQERAEWAVWQEQASETFRCQEAVKQSLQAELHARRLHDELVLTLISVGLASAGAHASNRALIDEILELSSGLARVALQPAITQQIARLIATPPSRRAARQRAAALPEEHAGLVKEMETLVEFFIEEIEQAAMAV